MLELLTSQLKTYIEQHKKLMEKAVKLYGKPAKKEEYAEVLEEIIGTRRLIETVKTEMEKYKTNKNER